MTLKKPPSPSFTEDVQDVPLALAVIEGKVMVSSLDVSEVFKKAHKNVLRDIEEIIKSCPAEFGRLNFEPSSYLNEQNKAQPMYNMTRNGFSLLVMAFTGDKALKFKIAYITQFEAMERALVQQREEKLVQNQNQNRISGTDWPLWSESAVNLMQSEYWMSEPEIKNLRFAIIGYLNGVQPVGFNDAALLRLQKFFVKGFGSVLLKENEVSSFALQTPAGRYRRMMGLLNQYADVAVAKINQALCDLGLEPV